MLSFKKIILFAKIPFIFFLVSLFGNLILPAINLPVHYYQFSQKILFIFLVTSLAWILINFIMLIEKIILSRYLEQGSFQAKTSYTKIHILRQIMIFFVLIFASSVILMTFDSARDVGVSLIASAGFLGVVAGFAAQKTLSTLAAGLQLAFTQPIKIGDAVFIEKELGFVEEITLSYVFIRLWDFRRLVVPVNFFLENIFQNWSRISSELLGTVFIKVDYSVNIDDLRQELQRILNKSIYWDKKIGIIEVTEFREVYIELRVLVSSKDVDSLWHIRCEIREKLLNYLLHTHPHCLPKFRLVNLNE